MVEKSEGKVEANILHPLGDKKYGESGVYHKGHLPLWLKLSATIRTSPARYGGTLTSLCTGCFLII